MTSLPLHRHSLHALSTAFEQGSLTSRALTGACLERIGLHNPRVNAVGDLVQDALEQADRLDRERSSGGVRGPLHGIPVLIKDNIDVQGLPTTAGSLALERAYPAGDAALVEQLRAAGAVILGKTQLSEFAHFVNLGGKNGLSSRGGQVLNPWGAWLDVGGSSSGAGAALAAGFAPLSVGTETSGSILSPAHQNGVVGVKPTVGLVSRRGVLPISHSQDTAGPMARSVRDAALLLEAMAAPDPLDLQPLGLSLERPAHLNFGEHLHPEALRGARLGVPRATFWNKLTQAQALLLEKRLERLSALGATLVEPAELPGAELLEQLSFDVLIYEFRWGLERYLSRLPEGNPRDLHAVLEHYFEHPEWTGDAGLTLLLASAGTRGDLSEQSYHYARARDLLQVKVAGLDALFETLRLDALVFPAHWGATVGAKAGYPSVCIPAGLADGAPCGITFLGRAFSEPQLLGYAHALEGALGLDLEPDLTRL